MSSARLDPRFTPEYLLPAMRRAGPLDPLDEALYRFLIIPATRAAFLKQRDSLHWTDIRPAWGAGRKLARATGIAAAGL